MSIQFTVNNFADEFYPVSALHELVMKRKQILAFFFFSSKGFKGLCEQFLAGLS